MGLPGFRPWLTKMIADILTARGPPCTTLFIDGNQTYYHSRDQFEDSPDELFADFIAQLKAIIHQLNPSFLVFIAMDGTAPAAKLQTQRNRKFYSEYDENFVPPSRGFPFTGHAERIDRELTKLCQELRQDPTIRTANIVYSSGYAPGESEHKYFEFVRSLKKQQIWPSDGNHYIYSFDNDLFILSLQFPDDKFYVNIAKEGVYDVSKLKNYLLYLVARTIGAQSLDVKHVLRDIMALTFLFGGDFMPQFPQYEGFTTDNFVDIIQVYARICQGKHFLIHHDVFNVQVLQLIVANFVKNKTTNPQYFKKNMLREAAQQVLRVFNFTYLYYTSGLPSWSFYVTITRMPPLQLLVNYMQQENSSYFRTLGDNEVIEPFLKALIAQPIDNLENIPWTLYRIKIASPIASRYWPHVKDRRDVPMFDLDVIKQYYKNEMRNLPPNERRYNRIDEPFHVFAKNS